MNISNLKLLTLIILCVFISIFFFQILYTVITPYSNLLSQWDYQQYSEILGSSKPSKKADMIYINLRQDLFESAQQKDPKNNENRNQDEKSHEIYFVNKFELDSIAEEMNALTKMQQAQEIQLNIVGQDLSRTQQQLKRVSAELTNRLSDISPILAPPSLAPTSLPPPRTTSSSGMSWTFVKSEEINNITLSHVGCHSPFKSCDAYHGDTTCDSSLPLLCITKEPLLPPPHRYWNIYEKWSGGKIQVTSERYLGLLLSSVEVADKICQSRFGKNWRMAEFHDGWGWTFWGEGKLESNINGRFWVAINDQKANCWN